MRPPWLPHSRDEAGLEALQTDVMRFLAILGLCLAAIFSLVQGAAREQVPRDQVVVEERVVEETSLERAALEQAEPAQQSPPRPRPIAKQLGYTLEFASGQALESLLQSGLVQLYASRGGEFWLVDAVGGATPVAAPTSYYRMQADTVPWRMRARVVALLSGNAMIWGVKLHPEAISQINELTSSGDGGSLIIESDGAVTLARESMQINTPLHTGGRGPARKSRP